jgi:hypothetical protein
MQDANAEPDDIKHIHFSQYGLKRNPNQKRHQKSGPSTPPTEGHRQNEKVKLVAAQKDDWSTIYDAENPNGCFDLATGECGAYLIKQIHRKIAGYKSQDVEKGLYDPVNFVDCSGVVRLLRECELTCYYCRSAVLLTYEFARDPRQWTLERINNGVGHTATNVEIACLKCNIRRRTMFSEKYVMTKRMQTVIKEPGASAKPEVPSAKPEV